MSVTTVSSPRSAADGLKITRSRRNVAWSGLGAAAVIIILFLFPYYVGPGTTGIMVQGLIVLALASM